MTAGRTSLPKISFSDSTPLRKRVAQIAGGLSMCILSQTVYAQLQIACPVDWYQLLKIEEDNLDYVLFGVKVRDWKPQYFDLVAAREDECMRQARTPESVRQAQLANRPRMMGWRDRLFTVRDKNLAGAERAASLKSSIAQTGSAGASIRMSASGELLPITVRHISTAQRAPIEWSCKTFAEIDPSNFENRMAWIDEPSLKAMAAYANVCLQAKAMTEAQAQTFSKFHQTLLGIYARLPGFATRVDQVAAKGNAVSEAEFAELSRAFGELTGGSISPGKYPGFNTYDFPMLKNVMNKLIEMERGIQERQCDVNYAKTKLPIAWQDAYYFVQRSPQKFRKLICAATTNGVPVRLVNSSPVGVMGKDGVEFKGKRTIEVYVQLKDVPNSGLGEKFLQPLQFKVNGKAFDNYVAFEEVLLQTLSGH